MIGEFLNDIISRINEMSGGNQFVAGSISLWLLTAGTYLLRDIPQRIYQLIKRNIITSLTFNNGGYAEAYVLKHFMDWIQPQLKTKFSRTLSLNSSDGIDDVSIGLGYGFHIFFYKRRLFWINKQKLESSGSERQKDEVRVSTFGRSHSPFYNILEDFKPKKDESTLEVFTLSHGGHWDHLAMAPKRSLESVAAEPGVKENLKEQIKFFKDNKEWFRKRAVPHKLTYILHGLPGTGKTSLIKAIASEFNMNICVVNINSVSDSSLEEALSTAPDNSIILIEDFDSSPVTKDRDEKQSKGSGEKLSFLTLTGLLNSLDGIVPMDNNIVFMTTNHLDKIDPALTRKGRVDYILEMNELSPETIKKHSEFLYPDFDFNNFKFNSCVGCKLNEALLYGKEDAEKYVDMLEENGVVDKENGGREPSLKRSA